MLGFKISSEKMVALPFTNGKGKVTLAVNGIWIKCVKVTKFLGMIFDKRLTWNAYIYYLITKCKKCINPMRALSGKHWGASQQVLLIIYRALIWSIIDFQSMAYNSTSAMQLVRLDTVQCEALHISTGTMHR